jgi:hypothetical protein
MLRTLFLLMLLPVATAQVQLPAPALWLEPLGDSLGILLSDGSVYEFESELTQLATNWQSEWLLTCDEHLLGVNESGKLAFAGSDVIGPEVALHSRPACFPNGDIISLSPEGKALLLLDERLTVKQQVSLNALPDAELVITDLNDDGSPVLVVLTDPSTRYPHGVLGDTLEATSISVYSAELELLSQFVLSEPFVFEQRRVTPLLAAKRGILATRSSAQTGAGVVFLEWQENHLLLSAEAPAIGLGNRWLNLFASQDEFAYAVRTPHIGGPLQRYRLTSTLELEAFDLGVTNHMIDSRNLDLAVLLEATPEQTLLAAPSQQLDRIHLIACSVTCEVIQEWELSAGLNSNLVSVTIAGERYLAAADDDNLWLWVY